MSNSITCIHIDPTGNVPKSHLCNTLIFLQLSLLTFIIKFEYKNCKQSYKVI